VTFGLKLRNIRIDGRRTTVRLEPEVWTALLEISEREQTSVPDICGMVSRHQPGSSFTSSLRVAVLRYYRIASTEGFASASTWLRNGLQR